MSKTIDATQTTTEVMVSHKILPQKTTVLTSAGIPVSINAVSEYKLAAFDRNFRPTFVRADQESNTQDEVINICTRKGHRAYAITSSSVLTFNGSSLEEKPVSLLQNDDFIAVPRWFPFQHVSKSPIRILDNLSHLYVTNPDYFPTMMEILAELKGTGTHSALAKRLGFSSGLIKDYRSGLNHPPVRFLTKLMEESGKSIPITQFKTKNSPKAISLPGEMSPELAEFLGLVFSDGQLNNNAVRFFNQEILLHDRFTELSKNLFGIENILYSEDTLKRDIFSSNLCSSALRDFLFVMGMPPNKKSQTIGIPEELLCMTPEYLLPFLNAYIAGDGHTSKSAVEIATSSESMVKHLGVILLKLGLLHRFNSKMVKGHFRWRVTLEGTEKRKLAKMLCSQFHYPKTDLIIDYGNNGIRNFCGSDVIPLDPSLLDIDTWKIDAVIRDKFSRARYPVRKGSNISEERLDFFIEVLPESFPPRKTLLKIKEYLTYFYFDRVKSISSPREVPDLVKLRLSEPAFLIGDFNFLI